MKDILGLYPPGIALDRLVHKHVMGLPVPQRTSTRIIPHQDGKHTARLPRYSERWEDMALVINRLRMTWFDRDPDETAYLEMVDCSEYGWRVDIWKGHHDGPIRLFYISAPTLPHAVCVAALMDAGIKYGTMEATE